ncbi:hypothetical protein JKF63_00330 [Porcisia hertigi]|uniref:CCZ1/INTU/HSP4 first Longin domain-containing protein n=1 Tax=Porcisia hertigi TaxID=2761500 RepID=A0A836I4S3_9TRYP|nr:hypothetical protein JKF63_00330 [Porcisia hertigi]
MTLATLPHVGEPLISLAVYCPLLCANKEERAADNVLFYFPTETHINSQMNQVGFCIAISSLAPRFGIHCSRRQTIQKQRSSVCLMSPVENLWVSAHVRGGIEATLATHHLLQISCALFELLYGANTLLLLTVPNTHNSSKESSSNGSASSPSSLPVIDNTVSSTAQARAALRSFFMKCATFISSALAAQCRVRDCAAEPTVRPAAAMSAQDWAQYLSAEVSFGLPLRFVSDRDVSSVQLGRVEEVVRHVLWRRLSNCVARPDDPAPTWLVRDRTRCCIFILPTLDVVLADSELPCDVVQALKYNLILCAPLSCTSFHCHVPRDGLCEVAVWLDGNVAVVLVEKRESQSASVGEHTGYPALMEYAEIIAAETCQLLTQPAAGSTTLETKYACWLATRDTTTHQLYHKPALKPPISASSGLVAHWRLRGAVLEGTPFRWVMPGLVTYVRTLVYSTQMCLSSPTSTSVLDCWTRWHSFWVYLRFVGATVTVLAWDQPQHQQPSVSIRQLLHEAQRLLPVAP